MGRFPQLGWKLYVIPTNSYADSRNDVKLRFPNDTNCKSKKTQQRATTILHIPVRGIDSEPQLLQARTQAMSITVLYYEQSDTVQFIFVHRNILNKQTKKKQFA